MNILKLGNLKLGEGLPKICIPLVGTAREELCQEALAANELPCQLVEWRADHLMAGMKGASFGNIIRETLKVLGLLKSKLEKPLLFTIRTSREGGAVDITDEDYFFINKMVAESEIADIVDIEAFAAADTDMVTAFVAYAHEKNVPVLLSNHDFEKTPSLEEMVQKYADMHSLGGDIIKLAVMPRDEEDVIRLLEAAAVTNEQYPETPLVAISMGELGMTSRICGGQFGSVITFASGKAASAPGQIDAETLKQHLEDYYLNE